MQRFVASVAFLLVLGVAAAQPPEDYTLLCEGEVIGTASYVDGELHASVVEGVACDSYLSVEQNGDLIVTLESSEEDGTTVTITSAEDGSLSAEAEELPQVAIDGKATAQENRAEATANADAAAEAGAEAAADVEETASENAEEGAENAEDGIDNAADAAEVGADVAAGAAAEGKANANGESEDESEEETEVEADADVDVDAEADVEVDTELP